MSMDDEQIKTTALRVASTTRPAVARRWMRELAPHLATTPPTTTLRAMAEDIEKWATRERPNTPEARERIQSRLAQFLQRLLTFSATTSANDPLHQIVVSWLQRHNIVPTDFFNRSVLPVVEAKVKGVIKSCEATHATLCFADTEEGPDAQDLPGCIDDVISIEARKVVEGLDVDPESRQALEHVFCRMMSRMETDIQIDLQADDMSDELRRLRLTTPLEDLKLRRNDVDRRNRAIRALYARVLSSVKDVRRGIGVMMFDVGMSLSNKAVRQGLERFHSTGEVPDDLVRDVAHLVSLLKACVNKSSWSFSSVPCPPRAAQSLRRATLLQRALEYMRAGSIEGQADVVAQSLLDDFFQLTMHTEDGVHGQERSAV